MAYQPALVRPPAARTTGCSSNVCTPARKARNVTLYLIVDGRSIEKELGEILGEKPNPGTRPDWGTVLDFARSQTNSAER